MWERHVQLGELFQEPMAAGEFAPGLPEEVPETPENAAARAKYQRRRKDLGSTMVLGGDWDTSYSTCL